MKISENTRITVISVTGKKCLDKLTGWGKTQQKV